MYVIYLVCFSVHLEYKAHYISFLSLSLFMNQAVKIHIEVTRHFVVIKRRLPVW